MAGILITEQITKAVDYKHHEFWTISAYGSRVEKTFPLILCKQA